MAPRLAKRHDSQQLAFSASAVGATCNCERCGRACKVNPVPGSTAKMLKRSDRPKGLCVNCAVHDMLRNLYPANLILASSGPNALALPHLQRQFFAITQVEGMGADAQFEEIDWHWIIDHWDLPFPTPIKRTATNPVTQEELDLARAEGQQGEDGKFRLTERELRAKHEGERAHAIRESFKHLGRHDEDSPADHRDGG